MSGRKKAAELVDLTREDPQNVVELGGDGNDDHHRFENVGSDQQPEMVALDESIVVQVINRPIQRRLAEVITLSDDESDPDNIHINNNNSPSSHLNNNNVNIVNNRSHPTATSTTRSTIESKRKLPCRTPPQFQAAAKKRPPPPPPASPDNLLKCPICIESFTTLKTKGIKPVVTRCGHLFCDSCLKKAFLEGGRKCPKCRRAVPKSATSVIEIYDI